MTFEGKKPEDVRAAVAEAVAPLLGKRLHSMTVIAAPMPDDCYAPASVMLRFDDDSKLELTAHWAMDTAELEIQVTH